MKIVYEAEIVVPDYLTDTPKIIALSATKEDVDQVIIYTGGKLVANSSRVFIGSPTLTPAVGMPYAGGVYKALGAEMSTKGGYQLNLINVTAEVSGMLLRVQGWRD